MKESKRKIICAQVHIIGIDKHHWPHKHLIAPKILISISMCVCIPAFQGKIIPETSYFEIEIPKTTFCEKSSQIPSNTQKNPEAQVLFCHDLLITSP